MSDNKPTWLILSHAFNMDGRAASQTITDKIPHLLKLGINPIVVSGILGEKDKHVEHHQVLPALAVGLRFDLRHYLKRRIASRILYRLVMTTISLLLLPFYLIEKLLMPIETSWSWAITAYMTSARIIKTRQPTLVYTTGGAYSAHLAGYWLSRSFDVPWIAEIHDPMVVADQHVNRRVRFAGWLEGVICKQADVVWWFTEEALARARTRHPELGERGHCLIPGANQPEFSRAPYQRGEKLVIGHFGSLAKTRNLEIFLQGLRQHLQQFPQHAAHIRLQLYGGGIDSISESALHDFPHPEIIQQFGRLETDPLTGESGRDQVLKRMNAVDCLLLLHGTIPFCEEYIPSKLYEYLWTQRPILALVWRNPQMENMLHKLSHWAVAADNPAAVAAVLGELYARWERNDLADSQLASPYTSAAAASQIVGLTRNLKPRAGKVGR